VVSRFRRSASNADLAELSGDKEFGPFLLVLRPYGIYKPRPRGRNGISYQLKKDFLGGEKSDRLKELHRDDCGWFRELSLQTHNNWSSMTNRVSILTLSLLAGTMVFLTGCGSVTISHVPTLGAISSAKMSDLHGSQPIEVKAGECSSEEATFGIVGVDKVVGKLSEWTSATVGAVRANLSARGATVTEGASKALTITITKAEFNGIPMTHATTSRIVLTARTPEGLNSAFEGSTLSATPISAVDEAVMDAVKKLLADPNLDAYLRK
jgi:hypothetical protein